MKGERSLNNTIGSNLETITVITITHNRTTLLERAIRSVKQQTFPNVKHYIVVDDCRETVRMLEDKYSGDDTIWWKIYERLENDRSGPMILAYLRNAAIRETNTEWVSFLDDDNEFYPEHLAALHAFAVEEDCDAVHSYREILYSDGRPYLEPRSPWGWSDEQRSAKYRELLDSGVATPNSNIWRDKCGVTIDTNVWLLRRTLFNQLEIPMGYTKKDREMVIPEDTKLMHVLIKNGIVIKTNSKPTVKYYLGGYSNQCSMITQGTVEWK